MKQSIKEMRKNQVQKQMKCSVGGTPYKKFKKKDWEIFNNFLEENGDLSKGEFEFKANRLFLDVKDKPKNCNAIANALVELDCAVHALIYVKE